MRGLETQYAKIPYLDSESTRQRDIARAIGPKPVPSERSIPNLAFASRLARRERNIGMPTEKFADKTTAKINEVPAQLADQAAYIVTDHGAGWLPFASSHDLEHDDLSEIREIFFVQHGSLRNANEYLNHLTKNHFPNGYSNKDKKYTLVIAPQFAAPIDLESQDILWRQYNNGKGVKPDDVLRWNYDDWRGAEPAQNKSAPIDSFTAMDILIEQYLLPRTPKVQFIRRRSNSQGGQFDDHYAAYGKAPKRLEAQGIMITFFIQNPGAVHYFTATRPDFSNIDEVYTPSTIKWYNIPKDSAANLWPYGLHNPPPYVLEYLQEYPLNTVINDYKRRVALVVGEKDNDAQGQLPIGSGPDEQGASRLKRVIGKHAHLMNFKSERPSKADTRLFIVGDADHNAPFIYERLGKMLDLNGVLFRDWWDTNYSI